MTQAHAFAGLGILFASDPVLQTRAFISCFPRFAVARFKRDGEARGAGPGFLSEHEPHKSFRGACKDRANPVGSGLARSLRRPSSFCFSVLHGKRPIGAVGNPWFCWLP